MEVCAKQKGCDIINKFDTLNLSEHLCVDKELFYVTYLE
jgi:hypothetical protein